MAPVDTFLELTKERRSIYALSKESTIPDSRVEEIVKFAIQHAPSTYNVQSARAVILLKEEHAKLWAIVKKHMDQVPLDEGMKTYMAGRIKGWNESYGTIMWFEDQDALNALADKNPMVKPMLTECMSFDLAVTSARVCLCVCVLMSECVRVGSLLGHPSIHR